MSDDEFLDPTDSVAVPRRTARRLESFDGKTITLLDRVEELLQERFHPKAVVRKKKPTFARPAPEDLRQEILKNSDAVIEALAD